MSYVASKGGAAAIDQAHRLVAHALQRQEQETASIESALRQQSRAVDRIMAEAALYAPYLAAKALLQAQGDIPEAVFLLRAHRVTLPQLATALPVARSQNRPLRRISAVFKDLPGGQRLGATYDYSHRLFGYFADQEAPKAGDALGETSSPAHTSPADFLLREGLLEESSCNDEPDVLPDLTREPLQFPAGRALRLQSLARADEGFLLGLAYSTQRGYGHNHPFLGELRQGLTPIYLQLPELEAPIVIGEIHLTECQSLHQSAATNSCLTRGYGLQLGDNERKAISMALVDRALRAAELSESIDAPAQDQEFVLNHGDNVAAMGFVEHLKIPHHVDFQSELQILREGRQREGGTDCAD
ncbi:MAG: carbon-phosphorus lyase complex subunit PhnI [Candidatus Igneacidithiobacillus chanchocoensis]